MKKASCKVRYPLSLCAQLLQVKLLKAARGNSAQEIKAKPAFLQELNTLWKHTEHGEEWMAVTEMTVTRQSLCMSDGENNNWLHCGNSIETHSYQACGLSQRMEIKIVVTLLHLFKCVPVLHFSSIRRQGGLNISCCFWIQFEIVESFTGSNFRRIMSLTWAEITWAPVTFQTERRTVFHKASRFYCNHCSHL